jgi:hypothetical protein
MSMKWPTKPTTVVGIAREIPESGEARPTRLGRTGERPSGRGVLGAHSEGQRSSAQASCALHASTAGNG